MNGPQPIQIADVMAYCAMAGMTEPSDRMALLHLVQAMDGEWLSFTYAKMERERKKGKAVK